MKQEKYNENEKQMTKQKMKWFFVGIGAILIFTVLTLIIGINYPHRTMSNVEVFSLAAPVLIFFLLILNLYTLFMQRRMESISEYGEFAIRVAAWITLSMTFTSLMSCHMSLLRGSSDSYLFYSFSYLIIIIITHVSWHATCIVGNVCGTQHTNCVRLPLIGALELNFIRKQKRRK